MRAMRGRVEGRCIIPTDSDCKQAGAARQHAGVWSQPQCSTGVLNLPHSLTPVRLGAGRRTRFHAGLRAVRFDHETTQIEHASTVGLDEMSRRHLAEFATPRRFHSQ